MFSFPGPLPGSVAVFYPTWKHLLMFHHKYFSDSPWPADHWCLQKRQDESANRYTMWAMHHFSYVLLIPRSFLVEPTQWLPLSQWFLSEDTLQCLGTLLFVTTWRSWCFWLLVVTGQGWCWAQYNTQDKLVQQKDIWPENVYSAKAEKFSFIPFPMPIYPGV